MDTAESALAGELYRAGNPEQAAEACLRIISADTSNHEAFGLLGVIRFEQGRLPESETLLMRSLRLCPAYLSALESFGLILFRLGNFPASVVWLKRALCQATSSLKLKLCLADACSRLGLPEADRYLRQAQEDSPDTPEIVPLQARVCFRLGRDAEGMARIERAAGRSADNAAFHFERGVELRDEFPLQSARCHYGAWKIAADNGLYHHHLWHAMNSLGKVDASAADSGHPFERVLSSELDYVSLVGLGNYYRRNGRRWKAEHCYRRALAIDPGASFAHSRLGCLLATERRFMEADAFFRKAGELFAGREEIIRLDPDFFSSLDVSASPLHPDAALSEMEVAGEKDKVVFFSADARYFERFAYPAVNSLLTNGRIDCAVHFHLVNPLESTLRKLEEMKRAFDFPFIGHDSEYIDVDRIPEPVKTYFTCARFLRMPERMTRYARRIVALDMDMIVLGDMNPALQAMQGADVGIMVKNEDAFELWNTIMADIICINPTPRAVEFFRRVGAYISYFYKLGKPYWYLDQIAIYGVFHCGFAGEPAPGFVHLPFDVHRGRIRMSGDQDDEPDETCVFWSLHANDPALKPTLEVERFRRYLERPDRVQG